MSETSAKKIEEKPKVLAVDDEKLLLKILAKMLSGHYSVKTASSGEEALEILREGYRPGVILSDQRMPGMNGSEFLAKSIDIVPDATRIILTGYTNPKDIIACINEGHAYMYLTKPTEDMELIQAIKLAFEHHKSVVKQKQLVGDLNKTAQSYKEAYEKLRRLAYENKRMIEQSVGAISELLSRVEMFYFLPHTKYVVSICRYLAEKLNYSEEYIKKIELSASLHSAILVALPEKYKLVDPYDIKNEKDLSDYFQFFEEGVGILRKIDVLKPFANVVSQIWERYDGSGYPFGLEGNNISEAAQIISIANIYHNQVYRLSGGLMRKLRKEGVVSQTKNETKIRHENAMRFFYRRAKWFEMDIFQAFLDTVKRRECDELIPSMKLLLISFMNGEEERAERSQFDEAASSNEIKITPGKKKKFHLIEKEISVSDLKRGMTVAQNVVTKNGILIVRADTELSAAAAEKIKVLERSGMMYGSITIYEKMEVGD